MTVYLIGMGTGADEMLTLEAKAAIEKCTVLCGAARFADTAKRMDKPFFTSYKPEELCKFLHESECEYAGVLLSGDCGFYSGAKRLIDMLDEDEVAVIPGISSAVHMCARLKIPWEDVFCTSLHGRRSNIIGYIRRHRRVFALLGGERDVREVCRKLVYYNMENVRLYIGERISYPDERIRKITPSEGLETETDKLCCMVAENDDFSNEIISCIPDDEFIRAKVPMTKAEVRSVTIAKLRLCENSVLWDVGAGTGSVSIEASLRSPDICVYAVEKNKDAVNLIEENKKKFAADNVYVTEGIAPDALDLLPVPTHVFIGGSSGNMKSIAEYAWSKNENAVIAVNTVSLESTAELINLLNTDGVCGEVVQMNVSRSKKLGSYNMIMANNPVYIGVLKKESAT